MPRNTKEIISNSNHGLDQIHIPDPVAQEISKLEKKINELERERTDLKTRKKAACPRKVKR